MNPTDERPPGEYGFVLLSASAVAFVIIVTHAVVSYLAGMVPP